MVILPFCKWVFPKIGVPQNGWCKQWKTLWTNGWFGGFPIFLETPKSCKKALNKPPMGGVFSACPLRIPLRRSWGLGVDQSGLDVWLGSTKVFSRPPAACAGPWSIGLQNRIMRYFSFVMGVKSRLQRLHVSCRDMMQVILWGRWYQYNEGRSRDTEKMGRWLEMEYIGKGKETVKGINKTNIRLWAAWIQQYPFRL